jgi:pyruvate dehydrogenase E2 component (dihydrolipoamide acetyltransferase)
MARVEVPMPQMGESIAEGTVSRWLKKPGESVARDEPLLEISTDKVDAEIPAPVGGVLAEVVVPEGQTVEVGATLAYLETDAGAGATVTAPATPAPAAAAPTEAPAPATPAAPAPARAEASAPTAAAVEARPAAATAAATQAPTESGGNGREESAQERLRQRSTPLVRRMAAEHGIDIGQVPGTGQAGRVTKQDLVSFMEQKPAAAAQAAAPPAPARPGPAVAAPAGFWETFYGPVQHPEFPARAGDNVVPMDRIRRLTADHMVRAKRIAPHVHSFIEIDFTQIDRVRAQLRSSWEQQGVKVSYTAFVAWACARLLADFPMVNATISGESIIYRGSVNIGIAVDLNPGLIVPVVRDAGELNLVGIAKRINDLAGRARDRKLKPDEIQGATFSITNPGVLGTIVGMPIIPEGTAAILGTGAIEKRVVVVQADGQDTMAIRKRAFFSLGYDHRLVDGADAARFLSALKQLLESFPETA